MWRDRAGQSGEAAWARSIKIDGRLGRTEPGPWPPSRQTESLPGGRPAAHRANHGALGRASPTLNETSGAADAHRYDAPEDRVEARLDETFFEPARTRCGTDAWNAAVREGGALSFGDAIAYGLEEPRA